jgi:hypothetical protein
MARLYCANEPNSADLFRAGGPAQRNRARALGQRRRWRRPDRLRLGDSGVGKGVALGRLGNAAHLSEGSG